MDFLCIVQTLVDSRSAWKPSAATRAARRVGLAVACGKRMTVVAQGNCIAVYIAACPKSLRFTFSSDKVALAMSSTFPCPDCQQDVPVTGNTCPHCGRPGFFPNVRAAEAPDNLQALDARYDDARTEAVGRGVESIFDDFVATTNSSRAVWCKPWGEVQRLAVSDKQGAGTYYQQIEADMRLPDGDRWDALRRLTDEALFPGYKEHIRFAALTLDTSGPKNYGPVSLRFRTAFIAHRASVFEENSVVFMDRREIKLKDAPHAAMGYRAPWDQRGHLAAAKLGTRLTASMSSSDFSAMLLHQGATSAEDDFVEVHIYGPVTIRTLEHVRVDMPAVKAREKARLTKAQLAVLRERLSKVHVDLEEVA